MPRYKHYDYNQTVMIPIELEKQITPGWLEYAIHKLVEERVKIEPFEKKLKNDETGRPAIGGQAVFAFGILVTIGFILPFRLCCSA